MTRSAYRPGSRPRSLSSPRGSGPAHALHIRACASLPGIPALRPGGSTLSLGEIESRGPSPTRGRASPLESESPSFKTPMPPERHSGIRTGGFQGPTSTPGGIFFLELKLFRSIPLDRDALRPDLCDIAQSSLSDPVSSRARLHELGHNGWMDGPGREKSAHPDRHLRAEQAQEAEKPICPKRTRANRRRLHAEFTGIGTIARDRKRRRDRKEGTRWTPSCRPVPRS